MAFNSSQVTSQCRSPSQRGMNIPKWNQSNKYLGLCENGDCTWCTPTVFGKTWGFTIKFGGTLMSDLLNIWKFLEIQVPLFTIGFLLNMTHETNNLGFTLSGNHHLQSQLVLYLHKILQVVRTMKLGKFEMDWNLVGGFNPSEKYDFVSWDDDIPNIWKVIKAIFQSTNQKWWFLTMGTIWSSKFQFLPHLWASLTAPASHEETILGADKNAWSTRDVVEMGFWWVKTYLVGGWATPLKNMKVRLDHHPNYWGK